jgi:hypothetical protein
LHHALKTVKNNLLLKKTDFITDNSKIITDNSQAKLGVAKGNKFL